MAQVEHEHPASQIGVPIAFEGQRRPDRDAIFHSLILLCPTCASDVAETLGVTGTLGVTTGATVVMRCKTCCTVYTSPAEEAGPPPRLPASVLTPRRLRRWCRDVPASARVLCFGCASELTKVMQKAHLDWTLERFGEPGAFDLIVLARALESTLDPNAMLRHASALLRRGGHVLVIVTNADSSCFSLFGGRHWSGYEFPATRQHLPPEAIRFVADRAGLRVRQIDTLFVPSVWLASLANWLLDWGASKFTIAALTHWWLPKALVSMVEGIAVLRSHGAVLLAKMEKP